MPVFVAISLHGDRARFGCHFFAPNPCPQAHTMRSGATGTPLSASCIDQSQITLRAHRIMMARFSALFSFLYPSWASRRFVFFFISKPRFVARHIVPSIPAPAAFADIELVCEKLFPAAVAGHFDAHFLRPDLVLSPYKQKSAPSFDRAVRNAEPICAVAQPLAARCSRVYGLVLCGRPVSWRAHGQNGMSSSMSSNVGLFLAGEL
jgi:hypothetical protein